VRFTPSVADAFFALEGALPQMYWLFVPTIAAGLWLAKRNPQPDRNAQAVERADDRRRNQSVRMAGAICQPFDIRKAVSTAVMPQTEPTERSIPPGQDDQGHAHRHDSDKGKVSRDVDEVFPLPELGIATAITKTMRTSVAKVPASRIAKTLDQVEVRILGLTGSGAV
jgi:hypothetical protein